MNNEDIVGDLSTDRSFSVYGDNFDPNARYKDYDNWSMDSDDLPAFDRHYSKSRKRKTWFSEFNDDPDEEDKYHDDPLEEAKIPLCQPEFYRSISHQSPYNFNKNYENDCNKGNFSRMPDYPSEGFADQISEYDQFKFLRKGI